MRLKFLQHFGDFSASIDSSRGFIDFFNILKKLTIFKFYGGWSWFYPWLESTCGNVEYSTHFHDGKLFSIGPNKEEPFSYFIR